MANYYKVLGLAPSASAEEIKNAFRRLAQKYHPDRSTEKNAVLKFREINEAYHVLSDQSKKAQYDLEQNRAKSSGSASAGWSSQPDERAYQPPEYYQNTGRARRGAAARILPGWMRWIVGFLQIVSWAVFGGVIGTGIAISRRGLIGLEPLWQLQDLLLGGVFGAISGITLPSENRLERVLKEKFKDGYHLVRSIGTCLAGAFFGGVGGDVWAHMLDVDYEGPIYSGLIIGSLLFGWIANEEQFWIKLRLPRAYFEMLFVLIRAIVIAVVAGGITLVIGLFLQSFSIIAEFWVPSFYGLLLGSIIGSIAPSDLLAYSRYASAYVGRWMVALFVILALLVGFGLGVWLREPILGLFG